MSIFSCKSIPNGVEAVKKFDKNRYLGKWYEIARIDFKFERDLNNTTAEYSSLKNGKIRVVNRGYNYKKNEWKKAIGKAKFVHEADEAMLKVSFFGPFYAGYNVIRLDDDYNYALIAGRNFNYLWILSRTPSIPNTIKEEYLNFASKVGFDTSRLNWVVHNNEENKAGL
jgi:apolipoprotein D and lipocalin family protein